MMDMTIISLISHPAFPRQDISALITFTKTFTLLDIVLFFSDVSDAGRATRTFSPGSAGSLAVFTALPQLVCLRDLAA